MDKHSHTPLVLERAAHCITRRHIDPDALRVLYRLNQSGFTAYLVGGGVRDLLLGRTPKDFDIGTDAHPNQIRKLFRNCFLIGRRFRLAHIRFGEKVIETSTFRRIPAADEAADEATLMHHDNTFGTPEEDARRRDFTINGLFYDIGTFQVIDHVGGLRDLKHRVIRCIGDPDVRFREDPVRMLRAVRFASRLGFHIEPDTYHALHEHHKEIAKASPARLLEEIYRLFAYDSAEAAFRLLYATRLMSVLFPELAAYVDSRSPRHCRLWSYLAVIDAGAATLPPPKPAALFGALYYAPFLDCAAHAGSQGFHAWQGIAADVFMPVARRYSAPKHVVTDTLWMLAAQSRFHELAVPPDVNPKRQSRNLGSMERLSRQPYFEPALALYETHLKATGGDLQLLDPWRLLSKGSVHTQHPTRPRRQRRRRQPHHANPAPPPPRHSNPDRTPQQRSLGKRVLSFLRMGNRRGDR
jgi:poly(A) polymerase